MRSDIFIFSPSFLVKHVVLFLQLFLYSSCNFSVYSQLAHGLAQTDNIRPVLVDFVYLYCFTYFQMLQEHVHSRGRSFIPSGGPQAACTGYSTTS
ncbi:hypothetical protein DUNSADRAFT_637 [Dunaliella salina]|uniref:Secreted protein n=1 Tax=Dunaliella salina TaxID=3046 RepID=A0ABQ7FYJ2_DUNSA|nr:hypothetical protein DUNSADRAFT_637 [Dunaliella salina]|eukprot:KAF5827440.1 hypothetical protein DUNSADRAFT_637 [Dunaliella salina]